MATQRRRRRGTTTQHESFTGASAEITIDTDKHTAVVHDGTTPGGFPLAREDMANVPHIHLLTSQLASANIPNVVMSIETLGWSAPGDGGDLKLHSVPNEGPLEDGQYLSNGGGRRWEVTIDDVITSAQFGVFPGPDDPQTRIERLQSAIDFTASKFVKLVLLAGIHFIADTFVIPSHASFSGVNEHTTIITMPDDIPRRWPVVWTGNDGDPRTGIELTDFTIDYNQARWNAVNEGHPIYGVEPRCLVTKNVSYSRYARITVLNSDTVGFSTKAGGDQDTGEDQWDDQPNKFVTFEDCTAQFCRGDAFDCSQSHNMTYINCTALDCLGPAGQAAGIEIEDGAMMISLVNFQAIRCEYGILFKGHGSGGTGAAPSPMAVSVNGALLVNCGQSIHMRSAAFHGPGDPTFDDDPSSDEFSKPGYGLQFTNVSIIAPRRHYETWTVGAEGERPVRAMQLQAWSSIHFTNLWISDGVHGQTDTRYEPHTLTDTILAISQGPRRIRFSGISIDGFPDADLGVRVESNVGGSDGMALIHFFGLTMRNAPWRAVSVAQSATDVYIIGYAINGNHAATAGSVGVNFGSSPGVRKGLQGGGVIHGYETALRMGDSHWSGDWTVTNQPHFWAEESVGAAMYGCTRATAIPTVAAREHISVSNNYAGTAYRANSTARRVHAAFEDSTGGSLGGLETDGGVFDLFQVSDAEAKVDEGLLDPMEALAAILATPVHSAYYKSDRRKRARPMLFAQEAAKNMPWSVNCDPSGYEDTGTITFPDGCAIEGEEWFSSDGSCGELLADARVEGEKLCIHDAPQEWLEDCPKGSKWKKTGRRRVTMMMRPTRMVPQIFAAIQALAAMIEAKEKKS